MCVLFVIADAGLDSYEGMIADSRPNDTFERVGPKKLSNKPSAVPELAGRPSRRLTDLEVRAVKRQCVSYMNEMLNGHTTLPYGSS